MSVAIFVEGANDPARRTGLTPLEELWVRTYLPALGVQDDFHVIPISKKTIVALDPNKPKMSGAAEAFDQLFVRIHKRQPFDRALVLWDLLPAWNPTAGTCRRVEMLDFFQYMSMSAVLPDPWKGKCLARFQALNQKANAPNQKLGNGDIGIVIMEPMFEDLLVQDEAVLKGALGIRAGDQMPRSWPRVGWGGAARPDSEVISPAIHSARKMRPNEPIFRAIRGDYRTAKNEWAEYLLRQALARSPGLIGGHPISVRLAALL